MFVIMFLVFPCYWKKIIYGNTRQKRHSLEASIKPLCERQQIAQTELSLYSDFAVYLPKSR